MEKLEDGLVYLPIPLNEIVLYEFSQSYDFLKKEN